MIDKKLFTGYEEFISRLDRLCEEIKKHYGDEILCAKGCSNCCIADIRIAPVEAGYIQTMLVNKKKKRSKQNNFCALLDHDKCSIYQYRPVICRTQGYPLLYRAAGNNERFELSHCEFNFIDQGIIDPAFCIDMERVNLVLAAVNIQFLRDLAKFEEMKDQRISLDRITDDDSIIQQA